MGGFAFISSTDLFKDIFPFIVVGRSPMIIFSARFVGRSDGTQCSTISIINLCSCFFVPSHWKTNGIFIKLKVEPCCTSKYILLLFLQAVNFKGRTKTNKKGQALVVACYIIKYIPHTHDLIKGMSLNARDCQLNSIVIANLADIWF